MNVVIVGGVAAGMSAAARLRRLDEGAHITVIERDRYVSYANCGLPYYLSGEIADRSQLLVATPEHLRAAFALDIRTLQEVVAIDRVAKHVEVLDRVSGERYVQPYDKLLLAQGAEPIRPATPGLEHPRIFVLRTVTDMDAIKDVLDSNIRHAIVIGASYIGLEVVEAFRRRGLAVDLIELHDQVLPLFDKEMAVALQEHLVQQGVTLHLGTAASAFHDDDGRVAVELTSGLSLTPELVILAVGVRPAAGLAREAGLAIGSRGGILVDEHLRTSDPDIYAAGDMIEVVDTVTGAQAIIALAGPANRQGRIIADHICGRETAYTTTQGTAIVRVFDLTAASTGASEKTLQRSKRAFRKVYIHPNDHAGYYPGAAPMHLKLLFAPEDGRLLGAQIVGHQGVDKRIDVLATAIRARMTVFDLEQLELAYAPPYGSAKDPVNMAGFVAANLLRGDCVYWYAEEFPERVVGATVVDVRSPAEYAVEHISGAVNIPLPELRARLGEIAALAHCGPLLLYCAVGQRSYLAYRILRQHGIEQVATLAGGLRTFVSFHKKDEKNHLAQQPD